MNARAAAPGDTGDRPPWPVGPESAMALNRTGFFDWDLDRGLMHMDGAALELFDLDPADFHGDPVSLSGRVPAAEASRLDLLVSQALKNGRSGYGAYFRIRRADGTERWAHTQGSVQRDAHGRPYRIIGILRDADEELSQPVERVTLNADGFRHSRLVDGMTAELAHARTVQEVLEALGSPRTLRQLDVVGIVVGMVEDGRLRLFGQGEVSGRLPGPYSRVEDALPLSETVRSMTPRYVHSRQEFAARYPSLWPTARCFDWSACAFLPLIAQASAVGAIGLVYRDKRRFSGEERTLLTALSSTIAQSLQRARLLEQEHELAEGLQRAMLPHSIPRIAGMRAEVRYRSAREGTDIGGDWYDVIPLPGGRVAAVVGDVQGHDTQAAAVMGQLRIVLRAYAAEGHSAAAVMARASTFLQDLDTDRFATCLYAEADPTRGLLRLVRAGHPTPLLRRPDGGCRPLPVTGALPLGISAQFDQPEFPVTTTRLGLGDTLLMFTDGLIEKPGGDLDDGLRTLATVVRHGPPGIVELADRLCEVPEGWSATDDMAVVLLHRERVRLRPAPEQAPATRRG